VFEPLLAPARYKGVFGGRGSGKSHFFGELLVEACQAERGTLAVCIREAQRTLAQSSKRLIESKIAALGLGHGFKVFNDKIETPGDGLIIFRGMHHQGGLPALSAADPLGVAAHTILAEIHLQSGSSLTSRQPHRLTTPRTRPARWLMPPGFFAFWARPRHGIALEVCINGAASHDLLWSGANKP
jgi:phage terminase large subunit